MAADQPGPLVLDQKRLTLTDLNGYYSIDISGLPIGDYTLRFGLPYLHPTRAEYWNDLSTVETPEFFPLDPTIPMPNLDASLEIGPTIPTSRLAGVDRFATSAAIAAEYPTFPPGTGAVFIASGLDFPDALSAAPLAGYVGAPLLLTRPDSLPDAIRAEVIRLAPAYIFVIGGTGVVSDAVFDELSTLAQFVDRIGGSDRYETSRMLVARYLVPVDELFIATGTGFADALAAAPAAGCVGSPVLLVNDHVFLSAGAALLTTGAGFDDALAGAAYGGTHGYPLLLTPGNCLTSEVWASAFFSLKVSNAILLGGPGSLNDAVFNLQNCSWWVVH